MYPNSPVTTNRITRTDEWRTTKFSIRSCPFASVTRSNVSHPLLVRWIRYLSGDVRWCSFCPVAYVTCHPVMSVGVRSVRWQVLNMFKTFHRTERTKASVTCTLGVRWCPFCPVLVRYIFGSCPLRFRFRSVDPSHDRTTTGRVTDKTEM